MDDEVQKLHVKLKQEQQRWDRECVVREKQQVSIKAMTWLSSRFPRFFGYIIRRIKTFLWYFIPYWTCVLFLESCNCLILVSRASMSACWRSESNSASWRLNVCAASESSWRPICWSFSKMWTGWGRGRGVWRWRRRGWKPSRGYCRAGDITARAACLLQYRWTNTKWGRRWRLLMWRWCFANGVVSILQVPTHSRTGSLDGRCSLYAKETVLATLNQNHLQQPANNSQQQFLPKKNLDGSLHSSSYTANVGLNGLNSLNSFLSQAHSKQPPGGLTYPNHTKSHGCSWPLHDSPGLTAQRPAMSKGTSGCRALTRSTQNIVICELMV